MRNRPRLPSADEWGFLIMMAAVIFGGWVRLEPAILAGFPVNDGGLFYRAIQAILDYGPFARYIEYNGLEIPFAYPPLGFHIAAGLARLLSVPLLEILHWLPPILSICTIPAVFILGKAVLRSPFQAGLAALFYAFAPRAFAWLVMGGGLTRGLGQLFLILDVYFMFRLFTEHGRKNLVASILFSTLVVLSHPEAAVHAAGAGLLLWAFLGRDRRGLIDGGLLALGTLGLTAVWWLPVLLNFGPRPLLSAAATGQYEPFSVLLPFVENLSGEPFTTYCAVFAALGAVIQISRRNYFLPAWLIGAFIIEPRNARTVVAAPLALLAGIAAFELLRRSTDFGNVVETSERSPRQSPGKTVFRYFLVFVTIHMFGTGLLASRNLAGTTVSRADLEAFEWVHDATPSGSRFLILTETSDPFAAGTLEWFPALTGRISVLTVQGREWLDGQEFHNRFDMFGEIARCTTLPPATNCIEAAAERHDIRYDFVYLSIPAAENNPATANKSSLRWIAFELGENERYKAVYNSGSVYIFEAAPHRGE